MAGFEGFEKRLEVEFYRGGKEEGLRAMPRSEIEAMLKAAECTIVSELRNEELDSYVLSESSLFIYPARVVIKTCGTTKLLKSVPDLLASAERLHLQVRRCRYTRGSFVFPAAQPFPHDSFQNETLVLDQHFAHLGSGSQSFVLPNNSGLQNWHIYVAAAEPDDLSHPPTYTLEMCMTQLDPTLAAQFFKDSPFQSASAMTAGSGIADLLPNSQICDFMFDPCGYSMNGIENAAHSTIHITPEDGFSYASFETMGYGPESVDLGSLVDRVLRCFKPKFFSVSVCISSPVSGPESSWDRALDPSGYVLDRCSTKKFECGSSVAYCTFEEKNQMVRIEKEIAGSPVPELIGRCLPVDGYGGFYVMDAAMLRKFLQAWRNAVPRVRPKVAKFFSMRGQMRASWLAQLAARLDAAAWQAEHGCACLLHHMGLHVVALALHVGTLASSTLTPLFLAPAATEPEPSHICPYCTNSPSPRTPPSHICINSPSLLPPLPHHATTTPPPFSPSSSSDLVLSTIKLPLLHCGYLLIFSYMGAYTKSRCS